MVVGPLNGYNYTLVYCLEGVSPLYAFHFNVFREGICPLYANHLGVPLVVRLRQSLVFLYCLEGVGHLNASQLLSRGPLRRWSQTPSTEINQPSFYFFYYAAVKAVFPSSLSLVEVNKAILAWLF